MPRAPEAVAMADIQSGCVVPGAATQATPARISANRTGAQAQNSGSRKRTTPAGPAGPASAGTNGNSALSVTVGSAAAALAAAAGTSPHQQDAVANPATASAVAVAAAVAGVASFSRASPAVMNAGLSTGLSPAGAGTLAPSARSNPADTPQSGEVRLIEMLGAMDQHMTQVRETQQGLVATVELACRRALGQHFGRLVLVGSAALRVETPGSDVDVVCFTRQLEGQAAGLPASVLRRVHWSLSELISQYPDSGPSFSMELIHDARVPILRVLWGPQGSPVAVDMSVDQSRPVDHVHWFQRVGAAPRPQAALPGVAPLVTLTLRCVKWWLRQRQIPRTKEGCLPTLAWLLMAVHVCCLRETLEQAINSSQRPMAALLAFLTAFFRHFAADSCEGLADGLDGVLSFAADGSSSEFKRNPVRRSTPWAELSVLDPTRDGSERLDLAQRLHPASQLLLAYELRRASQLLVALPRGVEESCGQSRRLVDKVFDGIPEGSNELPSFVGSPLAALVLCGELSPGVSNVEFAIIDRVEPRIGWQAPFLHRGDDRSKVFVRIFEVDHHGRCFPRKKDTQIMLCPCHFVCRVAVDRSKKMRLEADSLGRLRTMQQYLRGLSERHQRTLGDVSRAKVETDAATLIAAVPSPSRSRSPQQTASPPPPSQP